MFNLPTSFAGQEKDAPRGSNGHLLWPKPRTVYHKQCLDALGAWPGQVSDSLFILDVDPFCAQALVKEYQGYHSMATIAPSPQKARWLQSLVFEPATEVPSAALEKLGNGMTQLNQSLACNGYGLYGS